MSDERRPWYPTYADAHLSDPDLLACSVEAEGLLWRMCSWSHNGEPYGYVTNGGRPMTAESIAKARYGVLAGPREVKKIERLLNELLQHNRIGCCQIRKAYYVPKMVRIGESREEARQYGLRGGNPVLLPGFDDEQETGDWRGLKTRWNELAAKNGVRPINAVTAGRRKKLSARMKEEPAFWMIVERELPLLGAFAKEGKWFGLDYLIDSRENFVRFAEGAYRETEKEKKQKPRKLTPREIFDKYLNEIVIEIRHRPESEWESYLRSCADKYADVPQWAGKTVWVRAREILNMP